MIGFKIDFRRDDLQAVGRIARAYPGKARTIIKRSSLRAAKNLATRTKRFVKKTIGLRAPRVNEAVKAKRASDGVGALVEFSSKREGLIHFRARQTRRGVTAVVFKDDGRVLNRSAFIANIAGTEGGEQVYRRATGSGGGASGASGGGGGLVGRLPIERLVGASVGHTVLTRGNPQKLLVDETQDNLAKNILQQVDLVIRKAAR